MNTREEQIPDTTILTLIDENKLEGWASLYDKYAPSMYGLICSLVADNSVREEMLVQVFAELREKKILLRQHITLFTYIIVHTYNSTKLRLQKKGLPFPKYFTFGKLIVSSICNKPAKNTTPDYRHNKLEQIKKAPHKPVSLRQILNNGFIISNN